MGRVVAMAAAVRCAIVGCPVLVFTIVVCAPTAAMLCSAVNDAFAQVTLAQVTLVHVRSVATAPAASVILTASTLR